MSIWTVWLKVVANLSRFESCSCFECNQVGCSIQYSKGRLPVVDMIAADSLDTLHSTETGASVKDE